MLPTKGITGISFDFPDFSDFLGRLQPSETAIQKTPNTLGVEESWLGVLWMVVFEG
jgi:hypothetical protein